MFPYFCMYTVYGWNIKNGENVIKENNRFFGKGGGGVSPSHAKKGNKSVKKGDIRGATMLERQLNYVISKIVFIP